MTKRRNMTITVPEELYQKMKDVSWVSWSAVAREAFTQKLREIKKLEEEP